MVGGSKVTVGFQEPSLGRGSQKNSAGRTKLLKNGASSTWHSREPSAASRVCAERSGKNGQTALDSVRLEEKAEVCLDNADDVIDGNLLFRSKLTPMA